ncbi:MAG TPA: alpha/beta fold hydrolase, partial [Stellaceae bacterium]|nr:alpha/beta fold hydrolase [Stellaceae bacterium]
MPASARPRRSVLFMPGANTRALEKARSLPADGLILDLEDAVAPDFFGFGRSDKPVEDGAYTFDFHRNAIGAFIERLDLSNITLVCQDWGGLIGLTLPMDMATRFSGLLVMNTALGAGDEKLSEGFIAWRAWVAANPDMAVAKLMGRACPVLAPEEAA